MSVPAADGDARRVETFRPAWWLPGGHLQTVWAHLCRRRERWWRSSEWWPTPDGDAVRVVTRVTAAEAPWVVLLHGLEGSALSPYIGGLARGGVSAGWNVLGMEFRSCSGRLNSARRLYHSGETSDLEHVIGELRRRRDPPAIGLCGVSLGANVIGKWLGDSTPEARARVAAAVLISPPYDLLVSGPNLDRPSRWIYRRRFLRTLVPKALAKEAQYPGCVDRARVRGARSFRDFDTWATAALHGYDDAEDYWRRVSCGRFLRRIDVPTVLISARDDPFNPEETLPESIAADNPRISTRFTARGGHGAFVAGSSPWRCRYWAEERAVEFLAEHLGEAQGKVSGRG